MHKFFRAIGFSEPLKILDRYNLIDDVLQKAQHRAFITDEEDSDVMLAELRLDLGEGYGICAAGIFGEDDEFMCEDLYPYLTGSGTSSVEEVSIEEKKVGDSFAGLVDDLNVGSTVIFHLLNGIEFLKSGWRMVDPIPGSSVTLYALCIEGTVMLPILKTDEERKEIRRRSRQRRKLMIKAREGDENAMQDLSMQDMDLYASVADKLQFDDVYTLVDSYFMPTGAECDLYSVMGEIVRCRETTNPMTMEKVWVLTVSTNDLRFDVCVNQMDLFGEPMHGRRFKGLIWMQGVLGLPQGDKDRF